MGENVMREPGALPPGWMWTTLGEACTIVMGQSPPSDTYNTDKIGLPFYQGKAEFGDLYPTPVKWCSQPGKVAEAGDVLISIRAPVGPTNLCPETSCIGRGLAALRPRVGKESLYFLYLLRHVEQELAEQATGTTFSAIGGSVLWNQKIPLAPLPEQHRIVAEIEKQFTRLDAGVAALKRVQANLKRYRASVLKAACEGRLAPQDPADEPAGRLLARILAERRAKWEAEHPGKKYVEPAAPVTDGLPDLPVGWCWMKVSQVGNVQLGRQRAPQFHTGPHMRPYLRVANVFEDRINTDDILEMNFDPAEYQRYKLKPGDILLNEGQSPELLGRPAMYHGEVPGACFQNTLVRFQASDGVLPGFALCVFRAYMHSGRFRQVAQITTNIAHLSVGRFSEIEFPLPPYSEQHRIVAEVERRLSVVAALEATVAANLARAGRLRQAVLKRAFEGRLVAQEARDTM